MVSLLLVRVVYVFAEELATTLAEVLEPTQLAITLLRAVISAQWRVPMALRLGHMYVAGALACQRTDGAELSLNVLHDLVHS